MGKPAAMTDAAFDRELVAALPRLRRFAFGLAGSLDEADDLVQAACERALARRDQYEPGTRLVSWMYRIVQTVWIDQVRRHRVVSVDPAMLAEYPGGDAMGEAESRLALAEVRQAIAVLSPEQRTVLLLVSVEGLAYREAAEILGLPIGTIMSRLARARLALGKALEEPKAHQGSSGGDSSGRGPDDQGAQVIKLR
jgi:RNA polymerase sigma-70 factor (ECF subfamily)